MNTNELKINSSSSLWNFCKSNRVVGKVYLQKKLMKSSSLEYALFYSSMLVDVGGEIILEGVETNGYGLDKKVRLWKVLHVLNKFFHGFLELCEVNNNLVVIKKIKKFKRPKSYDIVFVYSGSNSELPTLINSIKAALKAQAIAAQVGLEVSIKVACELNANFSKIKNKFPEVELLKDLKNLNSTSTFASKKQDILDRCLSNACIILHARISLDENFFKDIVNKDFFIASPRVDLKINGVHKRYLDYCFIGDYAVTRSIKRHKALWWVDRNPLIFTVDHAPYIDGGITVFNLLNISSRNLFNQKLDWGQAEDIDMCSRAYSLGYLPTYISSVKCYSITNKLSLKYSRIKSFLIGSYLKTWKFLC